VALAFPGGPARTSQEALAGSRILVVDDEPANVRLLTQLLTKAGYEVTGTNDPRQVVDLVSTTNPDLLILDLHMPHLDGFEVMQSLGPVLSPVRYLPILILTADTSAVVKQRALGMGARDFLGKPFDRVETLLRIRNLLTTRHLYTTLEQEQHRLEAAVRERTRELADAHLEIVDRLARAAEYRDDNTGEHTRRVGRLAGRLARHLGFTSDDIDMLERAAALHDVGKVGIPDTILLKRGPLTSGEHKIIRTHTTVGARILSGSRAPLLRMAEAIALTHHERWDGAGYPEGRMATEIPAVGRIVALADAFDAMTHIRPYQDAVSIEDAVAAIFDQRGRHFDPSVVDAFIEIHRQGDLDADRMAGPLPLAVPPQDALLPQPAVLPDGTTH
jgi:putative two-component system response regulator